MPPLRTSMTKCTIFFVSHQFNCYGKLLNVIMFVRQLSIRSRVDPPDLLLNDHQLRSLLYVIMVLRLSRTVVVILINAWLELAAFC